MKNKLRLSCNKVSECLIKQVSLKKKEWEEGRIASFKHIQTFLSYEILKSGLIINLTGESLVCAVCTINNKFGV